MKKNITVSYDEEKLSALKVYLEQKGQTVEGEVEKAMEGLYTKTVPAGVREYLSLRAGNGGKNTVKKGVISSAIAAGADEEVTDGK